MAVRPAYAVALAAMLVAVTAQTYLTSGQTVAKYVDPSTFDMYVADLLANHTYKFSLSSGQNAWLYVRYDEAPTQAIYNYSDTSSSAYKWIESSGLADRTLYLGVWGQAYSYYELKFEVKRESSGGGNNLGVIIGGSVAGAFIVFLAFCFWRVSKKSGGCCGAGGAQGGEGGAAAAAAAGGAAAGTGSSGVGRQYAVAGESGSIRGDQWEGVELGASARPGVQQA